MIGSMIEQLTIMLLMIGIGYLIRKKGIIGEGFQSDLAELVMWVALPCSIIESGILKADANSFSSVLWTTCLSIVSYLIMILIAEFVLKICKIPVERKGLFASMTVFANTAFIGFPICSLLLGKTGIFYCSFYNMVFSLFFFTYGIHRISGKMEKGIIGSLTQDPGIIATIVMIILFVTQWKPPQIITDFLSGMSSLCTPLSMIVIGCMLTRIHIKDIIKEKTYYLVSALRFVVIPFVILLFCQAISFLGIDKDIFFTIIVLCAMPAGSLTAIYSQKYRKDSAYVSGGIMNTMLLFLIGLPLVILVSQAVLFGRT